MERVALIKQRWAELRGSVMTLPGLKSISVNSFLRIKANPGQPDRQRKAFPAGGTLFVAASLRLSAAIPAVWR